MDITEISDSLIANPLLSVDLNSYHSARILSLNPTNLSFRTSLLSNDYELLNAPTTKFKAFAMTSEKRCDYRYRLLKF